MRLMVNFFGRETPVGAGLPAGREGVVTIFGFAPAGWSGRVGLGSAYRRATTSERTCWSMAQKVMAIVKLQLPAGVATPGQPVGPALGQHGVNIMQFVKEYNARTATQQGEIVPVEITIFQGPFVHLCHQDPAGLGAGEEGGRGEQRRGQPAARQGRQHHPGAVARDRREEDGRPERKRPRGGHADDRRDLRSMGIKVEG